jgi:hypothetical protein
VPFLFRIVALLLHKIHANYCNDKCCRQESHGARLFDADSSVKINVLDGNSQQKYWDVGAFWGHHRRWTDTTSVSTRQNPTTAQFRESAAQLSLWLPDIGRLERRTCLDRRTC